MEMKITRISLSNFRGIKDKTFDFTGNSTICGQNGSGKSTIMSAFFWVFSDVDALLVKNPMITPLGASECVSKVDIELLIDGKPLSIAKAQKFKEKADDNGIIKSAITNSYEINSVEKSQRDFISDLAQRGIDMDRFLVFSHPNAFTADTSKKGREDIRKVLFEMASDLTDKDIAETITGIDDLKALLENYKLEEIEQMQKSTLKKIVDTCGRDNEIINARIQGLIDSKTDVDIKALEQAKVNIEIDIEKTEKLINEASLGNKDIEAKITSLKYEKDTIVNKANSELNNKKRNLEDLIHRSEYDLDKAKESFTAANNDLQECHNNIAECDIAIKKLRQLYIDVQNETLDEAKLECPTCHRTYEVSEINNIKAEFEESKTARLKSLNADGQDKTKELEELKNKETELREKLDDLTAATHELETIIDDFRVQFKSMPPQADLSSNEEYTAIISQLDNLKAELEKSDNERIDQLKAQKAELNQGLNEVIGKLAVADRNNAVNEKVEKLREERKQAEINRANAEKIIDQVETFKREKNNKLSDIINSHFSLIKWKLWDRQKNGNYIEVTEPIIDDKPMTNCANGSLVTLSKLSICNDLQRFYGVSYPVFVDDYSLMSSNTEARLDISSQLIKLKVVDGLQEIEIKEG